MVCLILLLLNSAAPGPSLTIVEVKGSARAGKATAALRNALSKQHAIVPAPKRAKSSKALRAAAKSAGAELLVQLSAHPSYIQMTVEWTSGGPLGSARLPAKHAKLTKQGLQLALRTIEEAAAKVKTAPVVVDEPDTPLEVEEEEAPSAELDELAEDEEYLEPETKVVYTIKDGRRGLTATVGYAMLLRFVDSAASDGTPPTYEGVLSPGLAFSFSLFPRRFTEGGGVWRDFGVYARGVFAFMPTQLASGEDTGSVTTSLAMGVQAGVVYRHLFGDTASAVGLGAELGVVWDQLRVAAELPFPTSNHVSPAVSAILEVPLAKKRLVWATRAGVMPVSSVSAAQISVFGTRQLAWGLTGASGLRSTFFGDYFFAEAQALVTVYWLRFAGSGSSGFVDPTFRDLGAGFQVLVGATY